MPKKLHFERNLKNVNIRQKDYDATKKMMLPQEPFYNTYSRVINMVTLKDLEKNEELEALRESMETWKQRALVAENKNTQLQLF
jgi:hypothetical protein